MDTKSEAEPLIDRRLDLGPHSALIIGGEAFRTDRAIFLHARKTFDNFRVPDRSFVVADLDEALDVLVRLSLFETDRAALDFELDRVFKLAESPWLPEPIDVIDLEFQGKTALCLVLADPKGKRLECSSSQYLEDSRAMLEVFHRAGLTLDPVPSFSEFVVDATGRLTFLGTDRVKLR